MSALVDIVSHVVSREKGKVREGRVNGLNVFRNMTRTLGALHGEKMLTTNQSTMKTPVTFVVIFLITISAAQCDKSVLDVITIAAKATRDYLEGKFPVREDCCDNNTSKCHNDNVTSCCAKYGRPSHTYICLWGIVWCGGSLDIEDLATFLFPQELWYILSELGRATSYNDYELTNTNWRKTYLAKTSYSVGRLFRDIFIGKPNLKNTSCLSQI